MKRKYIRKAKLGTPGCDSSPLKGGSSVLTVENIEAMYRKLPQPEYELWYVEGKRTVLEALRYQEFRRGRNG